MQLYKTILKKAAKEKKNEFMEGKFGLVSLQNF
jgi:hypothetical protein